MWEKYSKKRYSQRNALSQSMTTETSPLTGKTAKDYNKEKFSLRCSFA